MSSDPWILTRRTAGLGVLAVLVCSGAAHPARADARDDCRRDAETAQRMMDTGKLTEARPLLISCARASCPHVVRTDCASWLADVERRTPSLVVRAQDALGRDIIAVRVLIDGVVVAERLDGNPVPVDPGVHTVRYETEGATPWEERLLVAQGESNRVLHVRFTAPLAAAPSPTREGRRAASMIPVYASGAVALVALGVFVGLEVSAQNDKTRLDDGCGRTGGCAPADVDPVRTKFVGAAVGLGVAVVALGVGAAFWLLRGGHDARSPAALTGPLVRF